VEANDFGPLRVATITTFVLPVGLTLDIDKQVDPVVVGKTTALTFRLRQHAAPAATNVRLSVTLPEELQYLDARGTPPKLEGRTLTFEPLPEVAPGTDATFTINVRAERPAEAVKFQATAAADTAPAERNIKREESLTIVAESTSAPPTLAPDKGVPTRPGGK
jgi:hypothetical protein